MERKTHPIISVYGDTEAKKFHIILIIGREPNTSAKFVNTVGEYDFDKAKRCAFWNISHAIIGESIKENLNCKKLKDEFREKGNSFITYTDLSPEPIEDSVSPNKKTEKRRCVNIEEYEKHISNILLHDNIINRADLIILSGLDKNSVVINAVQILKKELQNKNKQIIEVPFFYPSNKKKIIDKITNEDKVKIKNIYNNWRISM